jgi:HSP20 family molecular chaperone IbpA
MFDLFGRGLEGFWSDPSKDFSLNNWVTTTYVDAPTSLYNFKLENDGAIQVYTQDLPGVKKEDLALDVLEDNKLQVSYERGGKKYTYVVIPSKSYDVETADAKLELGVLEIRFTKREVTSKKKILVK